MGNNIPLIVDLDGTLIKSDILVETFFQYLKKNPFNIFRALKCLLKGKAQLKSEIANKVDIEPEILPYNKDVIEYLNEEKKKGRKVILATASNKKYAEQIAEHLGIFDDVFSSSGTLNLSSSNKTKKLISNYGNNGFDYIGNSSADLDVWAHANASIVVNPDRGVLDKAADLGNIEKQFENRPKLINTLIKALRVHQWAKNILIFVPLAASHQFSELTSLLYVFVGFVLFGLCASSVYLLNDLLDLEDDRHHETKRNRPFASGNLDVRLGLILIPTILISVSITALLILPLQYFMVLVVYYLITLAYSFKLKRMVLIDVITLATLYTIRIIAGAKVLQLELTFWILAFSMFIFLSLALVKRYAELFEMKEKGLEKSRGRGYYPSDLVLLSSLGAASGYLSVLVLALYINDEATVEMYSHPTFIWLACPLLLYWISRTWMITHRGLMHDDPVVFAIKDKMSRVVGVIFLLVFWSAI